MFAGIPARKTKDLIIFFSAKLWTQYKELGIVEKRTQKGLKNGLISTLETFS